VSTQRLPPGYPPALPPGADHETRQLGPLRQYTRRRYMIFHLGFTLRLIGRCLGDPRVPTGNKALFLSVTGALLFALIAPEAGADAFALLIPFVGWAFDLLGLPFEGAVDWGFFVLAVGALMGLFPADVVRQHILELRGGRLPPPARW
jgi:hypothetical protein